MKRSRRPTIRDVAAAAGVSPTTVSDALSGKGRLPEATRGRVERVAKQLNYRPNAIARGLRGQGLGLVGIFIAPAQSATLSSVWYWASIATHLSEAILDEGFAPVLLPHNVANIAKLPIPLDGAIVVDPLENDEVLAFLRRENIGTVTIGRDSLNPQGPWIDDNYEEGIHKLLSQTVKAGEKIAAITLSPRKSYAVDALRGAKRWAHQAGSVVEELRCESFDDKEVDRALRRAQLEGAGLILAQNDRLASKILVRLRAMGLKVPDNIRLVSATDAPDLQHTDPPITCLRQYPERLGKLAAKLLFDVLRGAETNERQFLPAEIALRPSAASIVGS
jgi:DNA-binding LacI/PurR family transcriptional regulator